LKRANLETIRLPLKLYFIALLIAILPSRLKVGIYRLAGAKIGKRVKIGFGSIVLAEKFSKINIGDYTDIRSFSFIICKEVNIGKYAQIAVFVWVWGSGKLIMKDKCILSSRLRVDLRRNSLYMGELTGFATGCIIYTHTHFWPYSQGAVHILKDIVLGDYVFVGLNSVVLPGVNIGDYSVVGAGSVVSRSIPPHSFAAGCPAKVLSSTDKFFDNVDSEELKRRILEIAEDMVGIILDIIQSQKKMRKIFL
jgi:acetyltransferase-like isoleucine patch superfamily enzyme